MVNNNCQSGFSMLELIVVMMIIGMAATLVIPRLSSSDVTVLKAQTREAVAVLNYARRSAIVEGKQKIAKFYEGKKESGAQSMKTAKAGEWVSRGATLQWSSNVTRQDGDEYSDEYNEQDQDCEEENCDENQTTNQITFYPEGGSSGGEFILTYLKYKAKITVNPITGKIESEILYDETEE